MRKRKKPGNKPAAIILFFMFLIILGIVAFQYAGNWMRQSHDNTKSISSETGQATTAESAAPSSAADPIKEKIKTMSLEEKVGQLLIVGVDGYQNDENTQHLIQSNHVGGFILFKKNIQNKDQMLALLNSLKESNAVNKVPLFLSIDEEGGRVSRLPDEFLKLPSNKEIGKKDNAGLSFEIGSILGQELKMFGMNMDFAPVLDINSNPDNPVIGDRSFGAEAFIVSKLGIQTMKGIQSENIIPVVKHFPGHGDTSVDSHVGLPVVTHALDRLRSFELVPFADAIQNGADAVMIAHILMPGIDPDNPASFSKAVITDLLRNEMNFQGVVITDDFTMGAIVKNYDIGSAAVKSIQAGSDIVLVCHGFKNQQAVATALLKAAQSGAITEDRLDQSIYRILKLKEQYAVADEKVGTVDPEQINDKIKNILGF